MFFPVLQDSSASLGSEPFDFLFVSLSHRWAAIFILTYSFVQLARFLHDLEKRRILPIRAPIVW